MSVSSMDGTMMARGFDWSTVVYEPRPVRDFAELKYGKALKAGERLPGMVPVFGTNGECGLHNKPLAEGPGVVLGREGQGHLGVKSTWSDFWVIDTAYYAKLDPDTVDLRWFHYITKYVGLDHLKSGEKPGLNRDVFGRQVFPFPDLGTQKRIARILGSLDDKIELNREMNGTLKAMARALFKSWFVDFDPVTSRAAGGPPTHLRPDIAQLFPTEFEDFGLGMTPKGREVKPLGEVAIVIMGTSPPGSSYNDQAIGIPLVNGPAQYDDFFPKRVKWTTAASRLSENDDLIFCVRASTGASVVSDGVYCLGRGVCGIRASERQGFVDLTIETSLDRLLSTATGSTFTRLNAPQIKNFPCLVPNEGLLIAFANINYPWRERIRQNVRESRDLAATRDALLLELLSGRIRLRDAERIVEQLA